MGNGVFPIDLLWKENKLFLLSWWVGNTKFNNTSYVEDGGVDLVED